MPDAGEGVTLESIRVDGQDWWAIGGYMDDNHKYTYVGRDNVRGV